MSKISYGSKILGRAVSIVLIFGLTLLFGSSLVFQPTFLKAEDSAPSAVALPPPVNTLDESHVAAVSEDGELEELSLLSGAAESVLFGGNPEAAGLPTPETLEGFEEPFFPGVGTNITVNDETNDVFPGGPFTQSETSIAVSGQDIVVGYNDFAGPTSLSGYSFSNDGGMTFTQGATLFSGGNPSGDPALAVDNAGIFYYGFLDTGVVGGILQSGFTVAVSNDGGATFPNGTFFGGGNQCDFIDKEFIDVLLSSTDPSGNGPRIVVSYTRFNNADPLRLGNVTCPGTVSSQIEAVVVNPNTGAVIQGPVVLDTSFVSGSVPRVDSQGRIFVAWERRAANQIMISRSDDGGNSYTAIAAGPTPVATVSPIGFNKTCGTSTRLVLNGGFRVNDFPTMDIDTSGGLGEGNIYIAWNDNVNGDPDILFVRSTNGGANWSTPLRVNDDTVGNGIDQFFPWVTVDPNGHVGIIFMDRRNDPLNNSLIDLYHTESVNQGLTFNTNFRVTDVSHPPVVDVEPGVAACYMSDYNYADSDANHIYATWSDNRDGDPDAFFAILHNTQDIRVNGPADFDPVCLGDSQVRQLEVFNVGDLNLEVTAITLVGAGVTITVDPDPVLPLIISPDGQVNFSIRCTPQAAVSVTPAQFFIETSDPDQPRLDLPLVTCQGVTQDIDTIIANTGDFGDVCIGDSMDLDLTISNSGDCDLTVFGITSDSTEFEAPNVTAFPLVIGPGNSLAVPIRFKPTSLGAKSGTITVTSDDPNSPSTVAVSGNVPPGDIRVTGSTDFGDVCAEDQAEKTVSVCNVGQCNLNVSSAFIDCADFTLINNPFSAPVSPDSCLDLVVRFTPTSAGPKSCTLTIASDDPDTATVTQTLTANTPSASIDVPPDQGFPATVIQSVDACSSSEPFPVSNTGTCNLTIRDLSITNNAAEYSLFGLPSFPIILEPGHIAGEGALNNVFAPAILDRARTGQVSVTYVSDPITLATTTVTSDLCGEGVRTGARVLVTNGGVPLNMVKSIRLQRLGPNRNKNRLDTIDNARNLPLQEVIQLAPCASFKYHREYSTVSNPIQLAPGSYVLTVQARIGGKNKQKTVGFDVRSCDFNPNIVVDF